jgi:hypothetical protein
MPDAPDTVLCEPHVVLRDRGTHDTISSLTERPGVFFLTECAGGGGGGCSQISRNRLGLNDAAHELAKEAARKEQEKADKKRAGKKKSDAP